MKRNVDYGMAISVLPFPSQMGEEWKDIDGDVDLSGSTATRLVVRDLDHAQQLLDSCLKVVEHFAEEAKNKTTRGRPKGGVYKTLRDTLLKLIEEKPEPKNWTSTNVNGDKAKTPKTKSLKLTDIYDKKLRKNTKRMRVEVLTTVGDVELRQPLPVHFVERTDGSAAYGVAFDMDVAVSAVGENPDDAWRNFCEEMKSLKERLENETADVEDTESVHPALKWVLGATDEETVPFEFDYQTN